MQVQNALREIQNLTGLQIKAKEIELGWEALRAVRRKQRLVQPVEATERQVLRRSSLQVQSNLIVIYRH